MNKLLTFIAVIAVLTLSSCADIYYAPDAKSRANDHAVIAVAPPKVSIKARKKDNLAAINEQEKSEALSFQKEMYSWLLKRKQQNKIRVEILDVETTNALLEKAGYFDETVLTPNEICDQLKVDGILSSTYSMSKPLSNGAAVALGLLGGVWGPTNMTTATLEIHDFETKKLLWNYNHEISGSVGSTPTRLVNYLMKHASKKMPYIQ